jgi:hypothetical protein
MVHGASLSLVKCLVAGGKIHITHCTVSPGTKQVSFRGEPFFVVYNIYSMTDEIYDDLALERIAKERFGLDIDISQVILRNVDVSRTANATVFLTTKKQLFVFVSGRSKLLLGDIQKVVVRMGLKPELFLPPVGNPEYFNAIGREKFKQVFPGRSRINDDELRFYKTLAPYNPALVLISEVKNGEIYRYDSDAKSGWRVAARFAYRRIRTS